MGLVINPTLKRIVVRFPDFNLRNINETWEKLQATIKEEDAKCPYHHGAMGFFCKDEFIGCAVPTLTMVGNDIKNPEDIKRHFKKASNTTVTEKAKTEGWNYNLVVVCWWYRGPRKKGGKK